MKLTILLSFSLIIFSCGGTKNIVNQNKSNNAGQIFITNQANGLPGKCYQKMMLNNETVWTETLCQNQITKELVTKIQIDLVRLNYKLEEQEIAKGQFGNTTKQAIKDFQQNNNMAYGGLDWATINKLKRY